MYDLWKMCEQDTLVLFGEESEQSPELVLEFVARSEQYIIIEDSKTMVLSSARIVSEATGSLGCLLDKVTGQVACFMPSSSFSGVKTRQNKIAHGKDQEIASYSSRLRNG